MKRSTFLVFAILFAICTAQARSNLTREVTFESGNPDNGWSGTNKDTDTMSSLSLSSSTSRRGKQSLKADRRQGTNRSEVSDRIKGRAPLHKGVLYGWSLRVDKNTNSNGNQRLIVTQIHHHQAENRPNQWSQTANFIIRHDASVNKFTLRHGYQSSPTKKTRKDNYRDLCKATYGKWHDFVVQAKWTWRGDGYVRIWCDGKQVYEHKGNTYFDYGSKTKGPYWKAGAYTDTKPALVYVDEYRMGNSNATYADVDPAGRNEPDPPPPPPGPEPLPELRVTGLTWGKTGDNHVGIELAPVGPDDDMQLSERTYNPGSVTFFTVNSDGLKQLTIHRQGQTDEGRPAGWTFYLDKPVPQEPIRIVAEKDWIQGAPSIDTLIRRWQEPDPEPATTMDAVIGIEPQQ